MSYWGLSCPNFWYLLKIEPIKLETGRHDNGAKGTINSIPHNSIAYLHFIYVQCPWRPFLPFDLQYS